MKEEDISARAEEAYERCHNSVNKEEFINNFINSYKSRKMLDNYDLTQKIINLKSKFGRGLGGVHLGRDIQILDILMDLSRMLNEGYKACLAAQSQSVEESKEQSTTLSLENWIRNNLQEVEEIHEYSIATDTVRAWIDLHKTLKLPKVRKERMYTERDMIAFGVFIGFYQKLDIEEVLEIFNKESGNSEKPNNHIESFEKEINAIVGRYSNELTKPELVSKLAYILKSCELS